MSTKQEQQFKDQIENLKAENHQIKLENADLKKLTDKITTENSYLKTECS